MINGVLFDRRDIFADLANEIAKEVRDLVLFGHDTHSWRGSSFPSQFDFALIHWTDWLRMEMRPEAILTAKVCVAFSSEYFRDENSLPKGWFFIPEPFNPGSFVSSWSEFADWIKSGASSERLPRLLRLKSQLAMQSLVRLCEAFFLSKGDYDRLNIPKEAQRRIRLTSIRLATSESYFGDSSTWVRLVGTPEFSAALKSECEACHDEITRILSTILSETSVKREHVARLSELLNVYFSSRQPIGR